jgi:16S rRNA G966 N2-methylase RsmD
VNCADTTTKFHHSEALPFLQSLPAQSVDVVVASPPYENQRTYGIGFRLKGQAWVDWLCPIIVEAARVSRGLICINVASPVKNHSYTASTEWLVADLTRVHGLVCGPAPHCWWKITGIPGSGSKRYQRRDWEPVYSFAMQDRLPLKWTDNTAFGHKPKFGTVGGAMSNRTQDGKKRNQRTGIRLNRSKGAPCSTGTEGDFANTGYTVPKIANPGNVIIDNTPDSDVITARVGGGHMGHELAHETEAPFPLMLAERLVRWFAPPGGTVLDMFSGSGTTAHAALIHGRNFIGCDLRESQVELAERRIADVRLSLKAQTTLFDTMAAEVGQ